MHKPKKPAGIEQLFCLITWFPAEAVTGRRAVRFDCVDVNRGVHYRINPKPGRCGMKGFDKHTHCVFIVNVLF